MESCELKSVSYIIAQRDTIFITMSSRLIFIYLVADLLSATLFRLSFLAAGAYDRATVAYR